MFKKSLLSVAIAMLLACSSLFGCAVQPSPSPAPASSSESQAADASDDQGSSSSGTITVAVEFDVDLLEGTPEAENVAPFMGLVDYEVGEGATAYDALEATGAVVDGTPSYVTSINGIGEGLAGTASGWMYKVNGESPTVPANEYVLSDGDLIVWYYGSWS